MNWQQLLSSARHGDKKDQGNDSNLRTRFEQDYDRIVFSHPFRKLQDKTQVFPMPEDDFVHTRLTHSLEVSSVGRSLGKIVGTEIIHRNPQLETDGYTHHDFGSIVAAACLAHDLGNPPFGHAGESTISSFFSDTTEGQFFRDKVSNAEWSDLTNFEGNAQGFRILNDPNYGGLKCTFATLATFTKYPLSSSAIKDPNRKSQKKYGFTQSEAPIFEEIASKTGLLPLGNQKWSRHPLAFLVEAADDICYLIIDLEDATRLGLVPFDTTKELLAQIIGKRFSQQKLDAVTDINEKLGTLRAMAIHQLIHDCTQIFLKRESQLLDGSYDQAVTKELTYYGTMQAITELSVRQIYQSKDVLIREAAGLEIMSHLIRKFSHAMYAVIFDQNRKNARHETEFRMLPEQVRSRLIKGSITPYQGLQLVLDHVSGMTDRTALKTHRILSGNLAGF